MQLGRMFSVFNKYMIYESTRKQEMLNETFLKRFMEKLELITAIRSELQKKKKKKKKKKKELATSTITNIYCAGLS